MPFNDKRSSLFAQSVNDEEKKFYNIDLRCQCYKTLSLLPTLWINMLKCLKLAWPKMQKKQLGHLGRFRLKMPFDDKCSSLFSQSISDEGKKFITLTSGVNVIKLCLSC